MNFKIKSLAVSVLFAALSSQAMAATHVLDGDHFTVTYDDAIVGLFGTPSLSNSSLVFATGGTGTSNFSAQTDSGVKFTNSTFTFSIVADQGYTLTGFNLVESGDYYLLGDASKVSVGGQLRVSQAGTAVQSSSIKATAPLTTVTSFDSFETTNWTANASVSPVAALTSATVQIQNILGAKATASQDGYAFIEKKNVALGFSVSAVPEPESYAMLLAGLGLMAGIARRRSAKA